jgi:opacity protein-like surface antigen
MTALATALTGVPALAQDPEPSPSPEPPGVEVTGFLDIYYGYNLNKVDPLLRTFDVQHNAFSLSVGEVAFEKKVSPTNRVGFRVDLDFGKTADLVAAFEPGPNGTEIYKNIQQAYLSVQATDKLTVDAGKFVTPIGAEVIESQDNWNYTRSVLFGYAIPFYHVGLRAAFAASDKLSVSGFLVNGWNNDSVIYEGKPGLAIAASVAPSDKLTWVANFMSSLEVPDPAAPRRNIFDTTLTLSPSSRFSVMANFDYGKEGGVKWWGLAGYARYQATPTWALAGRYEYLDDTDGGFMTIGQTAQTFTVTSDHRVADALKVRLEYRLDRTKNDYFERSDGTLTDSQSTLTVGVVCGFGGKI